MNQPSSTNNELIARLLDPGDQAAWSEFVRIYESAIHRVANKLGMSASDAADATQEVLIHLASVISKWKPDGKPSSFRRWLYRVSRNKMLKLISQSQRVIGKQSATFRLLAARAAQTDSESMLTIEIRRQLLLLAVRAIRDRFSRKSWQAFWLTYIDGVDTKKAAEKLDMSIGAVYIARSRILNKLQAEVEKLVEYESDSKVDDLVVGLSGIRTETC